MPRRAAILSTTSLIFIGSVAQADVTPNQIWEDWQNYWSGFGYDISAQESTNGDTLTVSNLKMAFSIPDNEGDVSLTLDKIDFVQNSDGSVTLNFPPVMPMSIVTEPAMGDAVSATMDYTMDNMSMVASGTIENLLYTYTADAMGVTLKELTVDGERLGGNAITASFTGQDLSGSTRMSGNSLRSVIQDMTLGATGYTFTFNDPDSSDSFSVIGQMDGLSIKADSRLPKNMNPEDMPAALAKGFSAAGSFGTTGSNTDFSFNDGGDTVSGQAQSDSSEVRFSLSGDELGYSVTTKAAQFNLAGSEVPLPIDLQFGEIGFNMLMPVSKTDAPADFSLGMTLADFVTSDMLWSLADPGNVLPRDPATIAFDLSGTATMLVDFFDADQMASVENGDEIPAQIEEVSLNKLLISAAGAMLSGDGAFTLDNSDSSMFGSVPNPKGAINIELKGGMALMDKLVSMGLLPEQQAMGARMMLGLFARPGEEEDSLVSQIEINEEGHILANGQRIQ